MKTNIYQYKKTQESVVDVIKGSVVVVGLCWMDFNQFQHKEVEIGLSIISILFPVYCLFAIKKIKDAYRFHLLLFLMGLPITILILDTSLRSLVYATGMDDLYFYTLIGFGLVLAFGFMTIYTRYIKEKMKRAIGENVNSGRLNIKESLWDLTKPLHFGSPEKEDKQRDVLARLLKLSPIVAAVGLFMARSVEGINQIVWTAALGILVGCAFFVSGAAQLAISFQILEWEKGFNIKLKVSV